MKRIPTHEELLKDPKYATLANNADVRWMYDSWRFVRRDPYQFFGEVGEESTIQAWSQQAIEDYYKVLYLRGATYLFHMHAPKKVHEIPDDKVLSYMGDSQAAGEFIAARNYILNLDNGRDLINQWNATAYVRSKHYIPGKRGQIAQTDYFKNNRDVRSKNVERAKELYENGISIKAIAKELGVQVQTIRAYLKS